MRVENARVHATMSVAGLAAALASVAAAENANGTASKMNMALASATELLASHCIEIAESAGADHDRLASVVKSAVDIQSPGDLMTLTAAAATGTCSSAGKILNFSPQITWRSLTRSFCFNETQL